MFKQKMLKVALCSAIAMGALVNVNGFQTSQIHAETPWQYKLTNEEIIAVQKYTGDDYAEINKQLRNGNTSGSKSEQIKLIDKALKKAKTNKEMKVYRYVDERQLGAKFGSLLQFKDLKLDSINKNTKNYILEAKKLVDKWIGKTLTEKAYTSTSMSNVKNFSDRPILFEITIPKGTHAAEVKSISKYPNEDELLLPKNSKFKITGATVNGSDNWLIIKTTLIQ
ncbi:ADP-ribosyltransferase [Bacillus sp. FSL K6-0067]|uniref:ADP-ribosyltransferase n=1 Tax=Bacillus sp. FSL K6-0067 TaxID=2921412 RepID=UPI00077ADECF|nr:ADP-ribosyltransferase [Bacillus cereus]KXY24829.1 hypothetical protein AT267_27290 [Bacillus cereus]